MFIAASYVHFICELSFAFIDREKDFHFSCVERKTSGLGMCVLFAQCEIIESFFRPL